MTLNRHWPKPPDYASGQPGPTHRNWHRDGGATRLPSKSQGLQLDRTCGPALPDGGWAGSRRGVSDLKDFEASDFDDYGLSKSVLQTSGPGPASFEALTMKCSTKAEGSHG